MTVRARNKDVEHDRSATERIVRHLTRHGIAAHVDQRLQSENTISDWPLSRALDLYVDLIVAGAYHHSPQREALVGGVSRDLFQRTTVPVLMSHCGQRTNGDGLRLRWSGPDQFETMSGHAQAYPGSGRSRSAAGFRSNLESTIRRMRNPPGQPNYVPRSLSVCPETLGVFSITCGHRHGCCH
jgi:hypothetical protein